MHLCLQTFVHLLQYAGCYFQCNFAVRRGKKNENRICNTLKHDNHCTNDLTSTENGNSFFVSFTRSPETWHPKNIYFLQMFCFFLRFFLAWNKINEPFSFANKSEKYGVSYCVYSCTFYIAFICYKFSNF